MENEINVNCPICKIVEFIKKATEKELAKLCKLYEDVMSKKVEVK